MDYSRELYHHGIKGQKWGVRRFENEDGTLTAAGKARYGQYNDEIADAKKSEGAGMLKTGKQIRDSIRNNNKAYKVRRDIIKKDLKEGNITKEDYKHNKKLLKEEKQYRNIELGAANTIRRGKVKTSSIIGGMIGGVALAKLGEAGGVAATRMQEGKAKTALTIASLGSMYLGLGIASASVAAGANKISAKSRYIEYGNTSGN